MVFKFLAVTSMSVAFAGPVLTDVRPHVLSIEEVQEDTGLTFDQVKQIAEQESAINFIVLRPTLNDSKWLLSDGVGFGVNLSDGDFLSPQFDTQVRDGVWFFPNGGTLENEDGFTVHIDQNTLLVTGFNILSRSFADRFNVDNGSVDCGAGYYACCGLNQNGQWRARCVPNGQEPSGGTNNPVSCVNGGAGATGCSNGGGQYLTFDP